MLGTVAVPLCTSAVTRQHSCSALSCIVKWDSDPIFVLLANLGLVQTKDDSAYTHWFIPRQPHIDTRFNQSRDRRRRGKVRGGRRIAKMMMDMHSITQG